MGTILGIEAHGGAVLGGDRRAVGESGLARREDRVFEYDDAGAAAIGTPGGVAEFGRTLGSELDRYATDRGADPTIDAISRIAAHTASTAGVDAIVLGRDGDGGARLRAVLSDGGTVEDGPLAFGSGAEIALGAMENADVGEDLDGAERTLRTVLESVADRDPETGDEVRTVRLADAVTG